jgi:glycosyltransferase involved in cell wall biosynthesis
MDKKIKIAYFLSHPIQYFSPLMEEISKEIDLHVYYFSDTSIKGIVDKGFGQKIKWDTPLLNGYNYTFLKNYSRSKSLSNKTFDAVNFGVISEIANRKYDILIINGWSYFSNILVLLIGKIFGKSVYLRSENPLCAELKKSKRNIFFKKIFLKYFIFKLVDKLLYIGEESKDFFTFYGVPSHKLIYTPYAVNNIFFESEYIKYKNKRKEILNELNLPINHKVILFSAKYIHVKRPMDLIMAFEKIKIPNVTLVMVGEGSLRNQMESYINNRKIENIKLTGFVNQSVISKYYSIADVFVMCSEFEPWGLSINEAINFNIPVVVSDIVGSLPNLVFDGQNGLIYKMGEVNELSNCINRIIDGEIEKVNKTSVNNQILSIHNNKVIVQNLLQDINSNNK